MRHDFIKRDREESFQKKRVTPDGLPGIFTYLPTTRQRPDRSRPKLVLRIPIPVCVKDADMLSVFGNSLDRAASRREVLKLGALGR